MGLFWRRRRKRLERQLYSTWGRRIGPPQRVRDLTVNDPAGSPLPEVSDAQRGRQNGREPERARGR